MSTYIPLQDLKSFTSHHALDEIGQYRATIPVPGDRKDLQVVQKDPLNVFRINRRIEKKDYQICNFLNFGILAVAAASFTIVVVASTFIVPILIMEGKYDGKNIAFLQVQKPEDNNNLVRIEGNFPTVKSHTTTKRKTYPSEVTITSYRMLRLITRDTRTVIIKELTAVPKPGPAGLSVNCCKSVTNLTLVGPIRKSWLHYILYYFRFVETLCVDVDAVSNLWNTELKEEYHLARPLRLDFNSLRNIHFMNSLSNPILNWQVKLDAGNLEKVVVKGAEFSHIFWQEFLDFVRNCTPNFHGTVKLIEPINLCPECKESLKNMKLEVNGIMRPAGGGVWN